MNQITIAEAARPLVIYHKNCHDGFGAAWCFWNLSHTNFDFLAAQYNEPKPDCKGRVVYLVDFSYKKEIVKEICKEAIAVYLIDHHKTAIEDLAPLSNSESEEFQHNFVAYTDLNRSGAMLAWDFLHNVTWAIDDSRLATILVDENRPEDASYVYPPILLEHIQDRDLWKFKLDGTKPIHQALAARDMDVEVWDELMLGDTIAKMELWKEGAAIERKYHKDIAAIIASTLRFIFIGGYRVPVVNCPGSFASDIGNFLYSSQYEELDGEFPVFSATYYDTRDYRIFSLRSKDSFDVSSIAKEYGGGGHKNAAGFKVNRLHELARN